MYLIGFPKCDVWVENIGTGMKSKLSFILLSRPVYESHSRFLVSHTVDNPLAIRGSSHIILLLLLLTGG